MTLRRVPLKMPMPMTSFAEASPVPKGAGRDMAVTRAEMEKIIASYVAERGIGETDVPRLSVAHITGPRPSTTYLYEPSICVCVRGSKRVLLGNEGYVYDETHFLLTTIGLPTIIQINDADPDIPYTALQIILDLDLARQMMIEIDANGIDQIRSDVGIVVGDLSPDLLDAVARLVELQAKPHDIPIMNGLIHREILYRILVSEMGNRLRQIVRIGSQANRVAQAVHWLRAHYTERLRIEDLAELAGMAVSTLHRHFQEVTTLSPLQYQKQLRLHEARRLMLSEEKDAGTAALQVGYESVTQFTREYRRLFG